MTIAIVDLLWFFPSFYNRFFSKDIFLIAPLRSLEERARTHEEGIGPGEER